MKNQIRTRILIAGLFLFVFAVLSNAHPLGNFTINHYSRIEVIEAKINLHYVIDMAEIPAFQELQMMDSDSDGTASREELEVYANKIAPRLAEGLILTIDDVRVPLLIVAKSATFQRGTGGLETLRIDCDLAATTRATTRARQLRFEDKNYSERIGWREIVASPVGGVAIFNSSVYGNGITDELKNYPNDLLSAPLDERSAQFSVILGQAPAGSKALANRDGRLVVAASRDRLAELITVPRLTIGSVFIGLLVAMLLGGMHAMSPGHGKTVVGAYLVGARGTARHAAFLGLTVTITHTAGVFALGVLTLAASEYVLPEQLFPYLSFGSGALVVGIGLSLLVRRFKAALLPAAHSHIHLSDPTQPHSHGGQTHSHLPPGTDGSPITWRSLLALGISGGLLPCPSALVVLLAAISLQRVGYGLLLVVAFSLGLAGTLTAVGLAFVYAGRFVKATGRFNRVTRILPVMSALVISCAGIMICYEALNQAGINLFQTLATFTDTSNPFVSASALGILGLGLVYGLKHATEADHIVAVSTIVSEHGKLFRAALIGALWGLGHTTSLVLVGVVVLALKVAVPESVAGWLEFAVAIMIVVLGLMALRRALRSRSSFHAHPHDHGLLVHTHVHFHETASQSNVIPHSHSVLRLGLKPAIVGAVHGLAGSAALTLLVLTQISSPMLGFLYLIVFGLGSILGMLFMSGLVGLPFVLSVNRLGRFQHQLQMVAAVLSIMFGFWYGYTLMS